MNDEMDGWVREYMNRGQGERQHEKEWKKERKGKQMEPERGWADLISSQGPWLLLSHHPDGRKDLAD